MEAKAKEKKVESGDDEEEDEEEKAHEGGDDDYGGRLKAQMAARAARLAAAKGKGKSEKQIEQMSSQRMEEMIDFQASAFPYCVLS